MDNKRPWCREFIERQKAALAAIGYDPAEILDTPQDCPADMMTEEDMASMLQQLRREKAVRMGFDMELGRMVELPPSGGAPLGPKGLKLNPFVNPIQSLVDLIKLAAKGAGPSSP